MGYLVCEKCEGYYELQQGESPSDFSDECECGGQLKYVESLDNVAEDPEHQKNKTDGGNNRKKFTQTTGGKVVIIIAALAILFCIILLPYLLVGAGYFFMVHEPYQNELSSAKQAKLSEVNTYFKGPLATDPIGITLKSQIDSATTPTEVQAIDVLTPATQAWRIYQIQQINVYKGSSGTVRVTYNTAGNHRDVIMKVTDAQRLVTQLDANVLSSMVITT
ncbi:MAG TPA: DUF515 domain-containing protein [Methanobacterium sp.]|nr:DUF515 domain-containing protein [Methanobacterium sp.]